MNIFNAITFLKVWFYKKTRTFLKIHKYFIKFAKKIIISISVHLSKLTNIFVKIQTFFPDWWTFFKFTNILWNGKLSVRLVQFSKKTSKKEKPVHTPSKGSQNLNKKVLCTVSTTLWRKMRQIGNFGENWWRVWAYLGTDMMQIATQARLDFHKPFSLGWCSLRVGIYVRNARDFRHEMPTFYKWR